MISLHTYKSKVQMEKQSILQYFARTSFVLQRQFVNKDDDVCRCITVLGVFHL